MDILYIIYLLLAYAYSYVDPRLEVIQQVEYYLSDENLANDRFLKLDEDGQFPLETLITFKRLAKMTAHVPMFQRSSYVADCLQFSTLVECVEGKIKRRPVPPPAPATGHASAFSVNAPAFVPREDAVDGSDAAPVSAATASPVAPVVGDSVDAAASSGVAPAAAPAPTVLVNKAKGLTPPRMASEEWATVGKKSHKPKGSATRPSADRDVADDEMEMMFDSDTHVRPGAKVASSFTANE